MWVADCFLFYCCFWFCFVGFFLWREKKKKHGCISVYFTAYSLIIVIYKNNKTIDLDILCLFKSVQSRNENELYVWRVFAKLIILYLFLGISETHIKLYCSDREDFTLILNQGL